METITSISNAQMKHIKELQNKGKVRRETGTFVAEGRKMAEEACTLGIAKHLYFSEHFLKELGAGSESEVPKWAKDFPCTIVSDIVFREVADTQTPQGVLAVVEQQSFDLTEILCRKRLRLLLLEDIRDPGNFGTMVRTAEGAGMDAVIASKGTVDLYNPKVVRSTMGSIYRVPVFYIDEFQNMLNDLRNRDICVLAAHLAGESYFDEITYPERCGVLIGNEAKGLSDESAACANLYVKIPMAGKVESLNAAVAAALLMYRMSRSL